MRWELHGFWNREPQAFTLEAPDKAAVMAWAAAGRIEVASLAALDPSAPSSPDDIQVRPAERVRYAGDGFGFPFRSVSALILSLAALVPVCPSWNVGVWTISLLMAVLSCKKRINAIATLAIFINGVGILIWVAF